MTEEESKKALFKIHLEYMKHPPEERLELYDEYRSKRDEIKNELTNAISERKMQDIKYK